MSTREDIYRSATAGKAAKAGFTDPIACTVCGAKPAIFVWRRKGFCRAHKDKANAYAAATPMLLPKETFE